MRFTLLIALALMFLVSCARPKIDPAFADYVARFELFSGHTVNVDIQFGPTSRPEASGTCFDRNRIAIDREAWNSNTKSANEQIVFHELGHCVLDRDHNAERLEDGRPASLMNPSLIPESDYENNVDYYLEELVRK